jgi:hypothetical protein
MNFRLDESGQMYGTGGLVVNMLATIVAWAVLWLAFSKALNMLMDIALNKWISEGWVTEQSNNIWTGLMIFWGALTGIVFIGIVVNTILKAQALKEVRG